MTNLDEPSVSKNEKSIFAYDDYRSYLKDLYKARKEQSKDFSFRFFARIAGFKSPSFLKLVMEGKSNLSKESIEKFSKALKQTDAEAHFFKNLVLLNQATTSSEKAPYAKELLKSRGYRKIHPLSEALYGYLSTWYFVAIKEMVDLKDFREDPQWIANKLGSGIRPSDVKKAIKEMVNLEVLGRNSEGQLIQIKSFIMTADEVVSSSAAEYHRAMAKKAALSIDAVPKAKRELSALTVSVSNETVLKIKSMIQKFKNDIMEVCTEDTHADNVYQVNLHLFPLLEADKKEQNQ